MKKNLVRVLRSPFLTKMAFIVAVLAVLMATSSCKHDKGGDKPKPEPNVKEVKLTSVKVGSNPVTVADEMDAGSTIDAEVDVEFATTPADATLSFAPALKAYDGATKKGKWAFEMGDNLLKITVKKDTTTKEYTLKITKIPEETEGLITSITIGPHKKEGSGIVEYDDNTPKIIEIPVPMEDNGAEYEIKIIPKEEGAVIEYEVDDARYPGLKDNLKDGKIIFSDSSNNLNNLVKMFGIKVSKGNKKSEYKVKAVMMTTMGIFGSRYMGRDTSVDHETRARILRGEKDITMEISGESASVRFASMIERWKTILYNGEDVKKPLNPGHHLRALGIKDMPLTLGQNNVIDVIVSNSEWDEENNKPIKPWLATEKFKLNILSNIEKKADAFISRVLVNGKDITDEEIDENAFANLFAETPPEVESGAKANIVVELFRKVAKVKIQNQEIQEDNQEEGEYLDDTVYYAKAENIVVDSDGTLVEIVVSPKAEDTNYRETIMKFKLVYNEPFKFYPNFFDINDKDYSAIPKTFKDGLDIGSNPPYTVETNSLGMNFVFYNRPKKVTMKIADTPYESTSVVEGQDDYGNTVYKMHVGGPIDTSKKQVVLSFEPENEGAFSTGEWKFEITGTSNKSKIIPKFQAFSYDSNISDSNISEDFLNKLTNNGGAEYSVASTSVDLLISLSEYERNFLLEKIIVNNVDATDEEFRFYDEYGLWLLKKTIDGLTESGKDITIKFKANDSVADDVTWTFKLKSGGEKPSVPLHLIHFNVQGYGSNGTPFTDKFLDGIKNGSCPTLGLYGKSVKIYFATYYKDYLKEAKFKIDSENEVSVNSNYDEERYITEAEYTFTRLAQGEYTIIATVVPKNERYNKLEYKFKVKILEELPIPESYVFAIDDDKKPDGYEATLDKDFASLIFQVKEDVVEEVKIGKGATLQDADKVELTNFKDKEGNTIYQALKEIELSTSEEEWTIEVKSKNPTEYVPIVKCTYKLTGTAVDENNASFVQRNNKPKVYAKNNFKEGMEGKYIDDYGATSVDFTAYTMSKESKVKAIRVHTLTGADMQGDIAKELTRDGNSRKLTGTVDTYTDKPTTMKLWCIGKDGRTQDPIYGAYKVKINPIPLFWSYKNMNTVGTAKKAYDEIEVSRAKIKNNKVYMIFAPWREDFGFQVDLKDVNVSEGQAQFEYLGSFGDYQDIYKTSLDVTGMSTGDSKEIRCKLVHIETAKEAMTYKVKLIMKD